MRIAGVVLLLLAFAPSPAQADTEWQVRPFIGLTFGGGTTLVDLTEGGGSRIKPMTGINGGWLGEVFGIDVDLAYAPGYFERDPPPGSSKLVTSSAVTTFTGSLIVGVPKSRTKYVLRPYALGGFGIMHARAEDFFVVLPVIMTRPAVNVGGGVTGFIAERIGLNWELRYFHSVGAEQNFTGTNFDAQRLSFFRANMALVVKIN